MLCDSWLEQVERDLRCARPGSPAFTMTTDDLPEAAQLRRAQRFVVAPDAHRVVAELVDPDTVERVRHAAVAPADECWLEWVDTNTGRRVGVLLANAHPGAPAQTGEGAFVTDAVTLSGRKEYVALPIIWNLPGPGPALALPRDPQVFAIVGKAFPGLLQSLDLPGISCWLVGALSLIAAPHLTMMRDADLTRLNKARRRLGRREFLAHREIALALGPDIETARRDGESQTDRVGRALHHVRAHYRLVPGGVALVRQHWRGDARFGATKQCHTVRAARSQSD